MRRRRWFRRSWKSQEAINLWTETEAEGSRLTWLLLEKVFSENVIWILYGTASAEIYIRYVYWRCSFNSRRKVLLHFNTKSALRFSCFLYRNIILSERVFNNIQGKEFIVCNGSVSLPLCYPTLLHHLIPRWFNETNR